MQAKCAICGKPVGKEIPGAQVYHIACLIKRFRLILEKHTNEHGRSETRLIQRESQDA